MGKQKMQAGLQGNRTNTKGKNILDFQDHQRSVFKLTFSRKETDFK